MLAWIKCISFVLAAIALLCAASHGQSKFPNGVYYNLEQLRNAAPAYYAKLSLVPSREKFKLLTGKDSLGNVLMKEKILAYAINNSLYIRVKGRELNSGSLFSLAMSKGNFIVYFYPTSDAMGYAISSVMLGIAGPVLMAATRTSQPFFILSLRTGNIRPFNERYVENRLKEIRPDLMATFQEEPNKTVGLLLKYIDEVNKTLDNDTYKEKTIN